MNAIHYFKSQNIETTMITGDAKLTGEAVGRLVGVDQFLLMFYLRKNQRLLIN